VTRITTRFVLLIATAAVLPLVVYGVVSFYSLRSGTERSVAQGNREVAEQIARRISLYFDNNLRILDSIGSEITGTDLAPWQQTRILRNHVLDFPEFREVTVFDSTGQQRASSRVARSSLGIPQLAGGKTPTHYYIAPVALDPDGLPTTTLSVRLRGPQDAWVVAEISVEELWRTIDGIRVGTEGYALLLDENSKLIAHGRDKTRIASNAAPADWEQALVEQLRSSKTQPDPVMEVEPGGLHVLAVASLVPTTNWAVIVEQPTKDAFGLASSLERQLMIVIGVALLVTIGVGWAWGRAFIRRIFALTRVTRSLSEGQMDARVTLSGRDEIRELGDSFNSMADRLVELQEETRRQERQAMFGRVAAGLVHDINHPIQNIVNNAKLMLRMYTDEEFRDEFRKIVEREGTTIKRVLDDLRNIAKPMPLERFPVDVNRTVAESVETMQQHAETAGITLRAELTSEPAVIEGDIFALGRVYRNLILNAIQATAPGGLVVAATERHGDRVHIRVYDTGCGIPPERLGAVFEDFVTTKRRGLGLGLAISKKIVEQLDGRISVASEVGKGTTFVLDFPATRPRPMAVVG
jgi:two-component system, NtrC family, sensor histidine kinase HydH